jgi:hypothetical protein
MGTHHTVSKLSAGKFDSNQKMSNEIVSINFTGKRTKSCENFITTGDSNLIMFFGELIQKLN